MTLKEHHWELKRPRKLPKIKKIREPKPPKVSSVKHLSASEKEQIIQLRMDGMKLEWLALEYGVSHMTIYRIVKNIPKNI